LFQFLLSPPPELWNSSEYVGILSLLSLKVLGFILDRAVGSLQSKKVDSENLVQ
jgi:hypothetical protein